MGQATSLTNPVPQIEPGKAKAVSINELPADLRKVVEGDMRDGGTSLPSGVLLLGIPFPSCAG